jgi:methionyl-tRNA formyltransferase
VRALFFGTPAIAVPSLEALTEIAEVVGVVCQPDRPAGRGLEVKHPPVKARALALGLTVVQPEKIRTPDFASWVRAADADVALVIAYGRILPLAVLGAPRRGCMNLHASILPRYRGAAPITWSIVRGEKETGVSLMQMDEGMDTGPVYSIHRIEIGEDATADELGVELGALAGRVVRQDLARAIDGHLPPLAQDHASATHAPLLKKEDGRIAFDRPARAVHDHVRGMTSWPGAFTTVEGKLLKVLATKIGSEESAAEGSPPPGTVVAADKNGIVVACGGGSIQLLRAQAEGRKALAAAELTAGRTIRAGMVLGT